MYIFTMSGESDLYMCSCGLLPCGNPFSGLVLHRGKGFATEIWYKKCGYYLGNIILLGQPSHLTICSSTSRFIPIRISSIVNTWDFGNPRLTCARNLETAMPGALPAEDSSTSSSYASRAYCRRFFKTSYL